MSDDSMYSKDPSVGWVSVQSIRNVFTEGLRELDAYAMPKGGPVASRDQVLKVVDTMQYRLYKLAEDEFKKFFPTYKPPRPTTGTQGSAEGGEASARGAHEARLQAIKTRT